MRITSAPAAAPRIQLNDVHSGLNATSVAGLLSPRTLDEACRAVRDCARHGRSTIAVGARHAMGGQQFLSDGWLLDTGGLDRIVDFDPERGLLTVQAGVRWPAVLDWLARHPANLKAWTIRQKQTGADDFSLGGAFASNIHGRGLAFAPFVEDVESIVLIDHRGEPIVADRDRNANWFALAAGGYGLFGLLAQLTLRLVPRTRLRREVELLRVGALMTRLETAIAQGCSYGDFQFAIDPRSDDFLDLGIVSCYRPVPEDEASTESATRHLRAQDFAHLLHLAHTDPSRAFREYADFYLASHGQHYLSDTQQSGVYLDGYHRPIDAALGHCGSEMITELYVPRSRLAEFMGAAADSLRRHRAQPIYGTVRLVTRDPTSVLAWAREDWACIVFNLHVRHDADGRQAAATAFRALIDDALRYGGCYYLTYHRHATRAQVEAAYPQFREFLRRKRELDPDRRWDSDWYRHHEALFASGER